MMLKINLVERELAQPPPSLDAELKSALQVISARLRAAKVRHAFMGDVALALHGVHRCVHEVELLLGEEGLDVDGDIVHGRDVPLIASGYRVQCVTGFGMRGHLLADSVVDVGGLPVLTPPALIATKINGRGPRDDADIVALLGSGCVDVGACATWLRERRYDLARYDRLLARVR